MEEAAQSSGDSAYCDNDWTDEKLLIGRYSANSGVNVRFLNFWQIVGGGWREFEVFDDLDTRGGPPIRQARQQRHRSIA